MKPLAAASKGDEKPVEAALGRIKVDSPVVELDGDEMTRILWQIIKEKLIFPFLDMDIDYYDLSVTYRDETEDHVTLDAAKAILQHNVGIKCPTITPDAARVLEFNLQQMWRSPTATIGQMLGGTVFHTPIVLSGITRYVPGWRKPIVVGRHVQGDQYEAMQLAAEGAGTFKVIFDPEDECAAQQVAAHTFKAPSTGAVMLGMYNTRESVEDFGKSCFEHALSQGLPLYLSTKSSVLKDYDGLLADTFAHLYQSHYKKLFEERGLWYQHRQMDDMVAQVMKSEGGFIWACNSHDGDVLAGLVAQGFGGPALVVSARVRPDGKTVLTEAAHGTVTRHYRAFKKGEKTSTNPMACVFAWSRGLAHRAKLDGNDQLLHFSRAMEQACISAVQRRGLMTKDLALMVHGPDASPDTWVEAEDVLNAVSIDLSELLQSGMDLLPHAQAQEAPFVDKLEGLDRFATNSNGPVSAKTAAKGTT